MSPCARRSPSTAKSTKKSPTPPSLPSRRRRSTTVAGPEICCRHSQVDALQHCFSWSHADRATGKRATTVLAELAKNEEVVKGGAVPVLVCHLKVPPTEAAAGEEHQPRPFEHEVEKGAAFALGLLAVKMTYYVVYHGRVPGVYEDWEDCRRQVHRFSGNSYKGYTTLEEAETRYANFRAGQRREMWRTPFIVMMLAATASLVYYVIVV
nr:uncharacterized protein LOC127328377 [Lolium perenne]